MTRWPSPSSPTPRSGRIRPGRAVGRVQVPPAAPRATLRGHVQVAVAGSGARARGVPQSVHHVVQLVSRVAQRPPAAVAAVVGRLGRRPHPSQGLVPGRRRPPPPVPAPVRRVGRGLEGARRLLRRLPGAARRGEAAGLVLRGVQHGADVAEGEGLGLLLPLLPGQVGLLSPGFQGAMAGQSPPRAAVGGRRRRLGARREHVIVLALETLEGPVVASLRAFQPSLG